MAVSRGAISSPVVALFGERARAGGELLPPGFVFEQPDELGGERVWVAGRHELCALAGDDFAVAVDVGGDDRGGAGERAGEDHAEALGAERGRDQRLRLEQLGGELLLGEDPEQVDARRPAGGGG